MRVPITFSNSEKCTHPIRQVNRYLSETNQIQAKYESIKDVIRTGKKSINVPVLKNELKKTINGPSREELENGAKHFLSRADQRFFSDLMKKCNVGENLLSFKSQLNFLQEANEIIKVIRNPTFKERDELEHETQLKGYLIIIDFYIHVI